MSFLFFQAEDGIRDLVRSRGLGDVYKRQERIGVSWFAWLADGHERFAANFERGFLVDAREKGCLLYTSDAADERSSVDLGGRRIIKKRMKRGSRRELWRYV